MADAKRTAGTGKLAKEPGLKKFELDNGKGWKEHERKIISRDSSEDIFKS